MFERIEAERKYLCIIRKQECPDSGAPEDMFNPDLRFSSSHTPISFYLRYYKHLIKLIISNTHNKKSFFFLLQLFKKKFLKFAFHIFK